MRQKKTSTNTRLFKAKLWPMNKWLVVCVLFATLIGAQPAFSQNGIEFDMPLMINNALSGNINATIIETTRGGETNVQVTVPKQRFRQLAEKFANDEQLTAWLGENTISKGSQTSVAVTAIKTDGSSSPSDAKNGTASISLFELRQRGLDISFDPALLSIISKIPIIGEQAISLRGRRSPSPANSYAPSKFSTGLNLSVSNTFNHRTTPASQRGLGATRVAVNGFTNIGGFGGSSLFYEGEYRQDRDRKFERGDVTLIHDSYKHGVRYSFGDVRPSVSSLQSSPDLLGLSIERNYQEINPSKNLRPSGRSRFTLDRPSRVSFELNGTIVETQQLEPGSYSVDDFPFTLGANNVRVIVDDGFSNIEVANFTAFSDVNLLAQSAGVQRLTGATQGRRYGDDIAVLGFYERGINEKLTVGVQGEASENHALIGSTAVYGTRQGLFGLEVALSRRDSFDTAVSSTLSYRNDIEFNNNWSFRTNLQLDYQTSDFGGLTTSGPTSDRWGFLSSFGLSKAGYNLSLNASTTSVGDIVTDTFSAGLSKSFQLINLSLDYRYSSTDGADSTENISLNISKRFGSSTFRAQHQSSNDQYRLAWNGPTLFEAGQGSINRAALITNETFRSAEIDAAYIGSKFIVDADHLETRSQLQTGNDGSITSLRASTSIGFAGGQFAFGRPFNDGFIIANAHENLRGKRMWVTRSAPGGDLVTSTKYLSSTLIPINGSYRRQRYVFEVDDLPLGYDLGAGEIEVFPGFLAGYNYEIGSAAANTVIGKLLWPDNTPPSLIVGKLVPDDGGKDVVVFTNKTGRFVAERMPAGNYTVIFNNGFNDFSGRIQIEQKKEPGLITLDTITLKKVTK